LLQYIFSHLTSKNAYRSSCKVVIKIVQTNANWYSSTIPHKLPQHQLPQKYIQWFLGCFIHKERCTAWVNLTGALQGYKCS
jgi:hypothetical protein